MTMESHLKSMPELHHVKLWGEAIDRGRYKDALSILKEGRELARKRGDMDLVAHFNALERTTAQRSDNASKEARSSACCSFCGKHEADVSTLIGGANVFICDECVEASYTLIKTKHRHPKPKRQR